MGPIAVEFCCLFDLLSRAPLHFIYDKVCSSEHKLISKIIRFLKKGDLILLDSGFYFCATFFKILRQQAHFIIPSKKNMRPKVLRTLGPGDYLCQIKNSHDHSTLTVRVVFVYRNGFRRRRLITSLLDSIMFPASELARIYHMRWDIETFYRDFKHSLRATSWHCQTPETFHQELLVHMIVLCLIRIAMLEAGSLANLSVARLSFARSLTETRLFFKRLLSSAKQTFWDPFYTAFISSCAKYPIKFKPDRQFHRNKQLYRKKSRGLEQLPAGRKSVTAKTASTPQYQPETLKNIKGVLYLLS